MPIVKRKRAAGEPAAFEVVTCSSWDDFKAQLRKKPDETRGAWPPLYRGHARTEWKLASPWERELARSGPLTQEENSRLLAQLLEDFKEMTIGLPGIRTFDLQTEEAWLTLGRHYGLVTPLLDWTKSPYVAAFFAFTTFLEQVSPGATTIGSVDLDVLLSEKNSAQVAIWSLGSRRSFEKTGPPPGLELINSRTDIGHRQRAQRGVFTRLRAETYLCLEDYFESLKPDDPPLLKFVIPGWEAAVALKELRMMNITFATLFPDLVGAALQANFEMAMSTLGPLARLDSDAWPSILEPPKDRDST